MEIQDKRKAQAKCREKIEDEHRRRRENSNDLLREVTKQPGEEKTGNASQWGKRKLKEGGRHNCRREETLLRAGGGQECWRRS